MPGDTNGGATSADGPSSNALVVEWAQRALGEGLKEQVKDFEAPGKAHALPALPSEQTDTLTFVSNEYKSSTAKPTEPSIDKKLNPEWAAQSNLEPAKITNEDLEDIEEDLMEEEARLSRANPGKSKKRRKGKSKKKGKAKKWTPEGALKERAKRLKAQREKRQRLQRMKNAPAKNLQERARRQIVELIAQKREQAQVTRKERLQIRKKMFLRRLKEFVRKRKRVKRKYLEKRRAPDEAMAEDEKEDLAARTEQLSNDGALKMGSWPGLVTGEKSSVSKKVAWSPGAVFSMKKSRASVSADKKHIARNIKRLTQEVPASAVEGLPWKPRADGKKPKRKKGKMTEAPLDGVLATPVKVTYQGQPRLVTEIKASGSRVVLKGIKRESRRDRLVRLQAQDERYRERNQTKMARVHPWRRRQSRDVLGGAPSETKGKDATTQGGTPGGDSYTNELVDKYFGGGGGGGKKRK